MRKTTPSIKSTLPLYARAAPQVTHRSQRNFTSGAPGDKEYYTKRITELELELQRLNVLDHPLRIVEICRQISQLKERLGNKND